MNQRLIPALGKLPLTRLSPLDIQRALSDWSALGLSPTTVHNYYVTLATALKQAVGLRLITINPTSGVKTPRTAKPQTGTWTAEQARTFLASTADDRHGALWLLAFSTGLRRGELLALRWDDLDLDAGVLTMHQALRRARDGGFEANRPKTEESRHTVDLPAQVVTALRAHHDRQRFEFGRLPTLVFCRPDGRPLAPTSVDMWWRNTVRRLDLPYIRLHDLRHTHATLLLQEGLPINFVQARLGHRNPKTTLGRYSHVTRRMEEAAVEWRKRRWSGWSGCSAAEDHQHDALRKPRPQRGRGCTISRAVDARATGVLSEPYEPLFCPS